MISTRERIRRQVDSLLHEAKVTEPPVPVERIARHMDAQLRFEPFEGKISGLLFQENGRVIIGVNALHARTRQRFTIAHELGHMALGHVGLHIDRGFRILLRDEVSSQATNPEEIAANTFAAELLMPATLIRQDFSEIGAEYDDEQLVQRLAERYRVSLQAMMFRLTNLGFIAQLSDMSF